MVLQIALFACYEVVDYYLERGGPKTVQVEEADSFDKMIKHELEELFVLAGIGVVTIPLMLILCRILVRRVLKPLEDVSADVSIISEGDLEKRIRPYAQDDEIGILVKTLNQTFERYSHALERQARFTSNASHQLRTPLTVIQSTGEVILSKERSAEEYRGAIEDMLDESGSLLRIVEQQLLLARLDHSSVAREHEEVDLRTLVDIQFQMLAPLLEQKSVAVSLSGTAVLLTCSPVLIGQAFSNVISNALNAVSEGGRINVTLFSERGKAICRFDDNGPGVPKNLRGYVFERFAQGLGDQTEGSGLGLSVVQEIISIHGGTVTISSSESGGARVEIILPVPGLQPVQF